VLEEPLSTLNSVASDGSGLLLHEGEEVVDHHLELVGLEPEIHIPDVLELDIIGVETAFDRLENVVVAVRVAARAEAVLVEHADQCEGDHFEEGVGLAQLGTAHVVA
jgi:hypothetical protein